MKRILVLTVVGFLCFSIFSTFSMFSPLTLRVKAENATTYLTDYVQLTTSSYIDREPSWSPDSSRIAWFSFDSSGWYRHIWKMNADGTEKTQLTFGSVVDETGDWSPNGMQIAFSRYASYRGIDGFDIWVMNADGTNVRQLTSTGFNRIVPQWSHDGTRLVFQYGGTDWPASELHVMNADGTNEIAIVTGLPVETRGQWSPDDGYIVYDGIDGIRLVSTTPPYEKRLLYQTSQPVAYPVFSPDGKYILFQMAGDLHLIDANGNYIAQLTNDGTIEYPHDWSPDGQWVAFTSSRSGNRDIWKARINITPVVIANVDIDPDTLNLQSEGKWITAYIELPEGYDAADIDASTLKLNGTVPAQLEPISIGDYDNDCVPDLMIKFDRAAVQSMINGAGINYGHVALTLAGRLFDETPLEGTDFIFVIHSDGGGRRR